MRYIAFISSLLIFISCTSTTHKEAHTVLADTTIQEKSKIDDTLKFKSYAFFKRTDILAYSTAALQSSRNQIYAGGLTICWKEAGKALGLNPIPLLNGPAWLNDFNSEPLTYKDIDPASIQISIGIPDNTKLPSYVNAIDPQGHYLLAVVKLEKELLFVDEMSSSNEYNAFPDFSFQGAKVQYNYADSPLLYTLYDYKNDNDFILKIPVKDPETEVFLACVQPDATLRATYDNVVARMKKKQTPLKGSDEIIFPTVQFYTERVYKELECPITNTDLHVSKVSQNIKFILNHEGLKLIEIDSAATDSVAMGPPPEPPKPKHLYFDQPFLLIVKQRNSTRPFYLMWIANDELMIKQ